VLEPSGSSSAAGTTGVVEGTVGGAAASGPGGATDAAATGAEATLGAKGRAERSISPRPDTERRGSAVETGHGVSSNSRSGDDTAACSALCSSVDAELGTGDTIRRAKDGRRVGRSPQSCDEAAPSRWRQGPRSTVAA
jgi:hypothetical protein